MPSYAVDSARTALMATGIAEAVPEWEDLPDGRRRPSGTQASDEASGLPLWQVEVIYQQTSWGRTTTVTNRVTVAADRAPEVTPFTPVRFADLAVEVRVNRKSGVLIETWRASALAAGQDTAGGTDTAGSVTDLTPSAKGTRRTTGRPAGESGVAA